MSLITGACDERHFGRFDSPVPLPRSDEEGPRRRGPSYIASLCIDTPIVSILKRRVLRSDTPGMAIGTVHRAEIANVHRVLELLRLHLGQMRAAFFLVKQRMT